MHARVKELSCLYCISHIVDSGGSLPDILQKITNSIPSSWQYPEATICRIYLDGNTYKTRDDCEQSCAVCPHAFISQPIVANGYPFGEIRICYKEQKPEADEGPFLSAERNLIKTIAEVLGNVLQLKHTEKEKQQTLSQLQATLEATADGIMVVGNDEKVKVINKRFLKILNMPDTILASGDTNKCLPILLAALVNPEQFLKTMQEIYPSFDHSSLDTLLLKDGRVFECYSRPQKLGQETIGRVWSFRDVTEQKRNESLLAQAKNQWESTFDAISDWVSIINKEHNIIRSNENSKNLLGVSAKQVVGRRCYEIVHAADCPIPDCPLEKAIKSNCREVMEFQTEGGRWLQVSVDPIQSESNDELFVHIVRDISYRKRAEVEKAKLEVQNRQVHKSESLARMAGAIAHHFNNQLCVVMGNLELALDNLTGDAATRKHLDEAIRATRRSADVSGLLLTYLGQGTGSREPLDLSEVCGKNLPMLQAVIPENIAFEKALPATGPVVVANPNQMRKVLTQLIINGAEAIGDRNGKLTLAVKTILASAIPKANIAPIDWKPAADMYACLEVTDTGCGIAEQDMEKVFDPFFTTKFTGRGIGLAVVQGIVKACNGAISVESAKNHGSTFCIFLPLVIDTTSGKPETGTAAPNPEQTGTVLLVEDQEPVRKMAETMIEGLGFSVLAASGGGEAVELFRQHRSKIRCVITDLTMPHMDGWETIAALRKIQPGLPVILASGYDEAQAMGRDAAEQPQAFLHKPYSKVELKLALIRALGDDAQRVF